MQISNDTSSIIVRDQAKFEKTPAVKKTAKKEAREKISAASKAPGRNPPEKHPLTPVCN